MPRRARPRVLHLSSKGTVGGTNKLLLEYLSASDGSVENYVCFLRAGAGRRQPSVLGAFEEAGHAPLTIAHSRLGHVMTTSRVAASIRRRSVDIVHCYLPLAQICGGVAGKITGARVATTLVTSRAPVGQTMRDRLARVRTRAALGLADGIVTVSDAVGRAWADAFPPISAKLTTIYPGMRVDGLIAEEPGDALTALRTELGLDPSCPTIVCVGRLDPLKGQATAIDMMQEVRRVQPRARLLLVGEGAERSRLQEQVSDSGLDDSVIFAGARSDIHRILRLADVFVAPSRAEGLVGYATLEAMTVGLPVVASDIPGVSEVVVDEEAALLARPERPAEFAERVVRILEDPDLATRLGRSAEALARTLCDPNRMARAQDDFYRNLLG